MPMAPPLGPPSASLRRPRAQLVLGALAAIALLPGWASSAGAATCEGRGCDACVGSPFGRALRKHESSIACIVLQPGDGDSGGKKAVFYPRVDEYSVMEVTDFGEDLTNIWVAVEGMGTIGQNADLEWIDHTKRFKAGPNVVPFFTVIVHLDMGVVERVQWDSGCSTCSSANAACMADDSGAVCKPNGGSIGPCSDCSISASACTDGACVPRVYIAWLGTDASGEPCTSAGKIISRFRAYSMRGLYDSASGSSVELNNLEE